MYIPPAVEPGFTFYCGPRDLLLARLDLLLGALDLLLGALDLCISLHNARPTCTRKPVKKSILEDSDR